MIWLIVQAARLQRVADEAQTDDARETALERAEDFRREAEVCANDIVGRSARVRRALGRDAWGS